MRENANLKAGETIYIGIDVGKEKLDIAIPTSEKAYHTFTVENSHAGVEQLIGMLPPNPHCIMEATGVYSRLSAYRLHELGVKVSVINPKQSAHFAKMLNRTTKTDKSDSKLLALYGARMEPSLFKPLSANILKIKQKSGMLRQLKKQLQMCNGIAEAYSRDVVSDESLTARNLAVSEFLQTQIGELEKEIFEDTRKDFQEMYDLALSIPGIGKKVGAMLVVATGGFAAFDNASQFAQFMGIAPAHRQSGTSMDFSPGITRSGDPDLRSKLYVCTWTAIKYNEGCKAMYNRLKKKGKPSKLALIAVANKLLKQVFAVVKSGQKYDPNYMITN